MARLTFVVLCILLQSSFPQGNNNFYQQADHIPLIVFNWSEYPSGGYNYGKIMEMGGDAVVVCGLTYDGYSQIKSTAPNLKMIPYRAQYNINQELYNHIARYSEGIYNEWRIAGNSAHSGKIMMDWNREIGESVFDTDVGDTVIKTQNGAQPDTLVIGPGEMNGSNFIPGFSQQKNFIIAPTGDIVYNIKYKVKIDINPDYIGDIPSCTNNDTLVCKMRVIYANYDSLDNIIGYTEIGNPKILKVKDFLSYGDWIEIGKGAYTLPEVLSKDEYISEGKELEYDRKFVKHIEFRIEWCGPSYLNFYIHKLTNYDVRGNAIMTDPIAQNLIQAIAQNETNPTLYPSASYDETVIGWYPVDEPGTIDNAIPLQKLDDLINSATSGKRRLWVVFAGCFNGKGAMPKDILVHEEMLRRTNLYYPTLQKLMYERPYQSSDPDGQDYRPEYVCSWANISHLIVNIEQFSKFDKGNLYTHPFGLMIQTGKWGNYLYKIPSKGQFLYSANMGLLYGAKLIALNNYFYTGDIKTSLCKMDNPQNPEYQPLWFTIKDTLSPRLKGLFGKKLKQLNAVDQYTDQTTGQINNLSYIKSISTSGCSEEASNSIIDLGMFSETAFPEIKYFMICNRYYSECSEFEVQLSGLTTHQNWFVTDYVDTCRKELSPVGEYWRFYDTISRGDARLYGVRSTVQYGGEINYNETVTNDSLQENELIIKQGKTLTVMGTYNCYKDIIVNSGGKLDIRPGSTLNFHNGSKIIVNGSFIAKGKSDSLISINFQSVNGTSQNGIILNPGTTDSIRYCKIQNGYYGIKADSAGAYIEYNEILSCIDGIYVIDSDYNPETGGGIKIMRNKIHNNTGTGVNLLNSGPMIWNNEIKENGGGVACVDNSNALMGSEGISGDNEITENEIGVYSCDSSPIVGWVEMGYYGENSISGMNNGIFDLIAIEESYIMGENNWWGEYPADDGDFYINKSDLIYTPELDYNPFGGGNNPEEEGEIRISPEISTEGTTKEKYLLAVKKYHQGERTGVRKLIKEIVIEEPDSVIAIAAIRLLFKLIDGEGEKDSAESYLQGVSQINTGKEISVYAKLRRAELNRGDYISALNTILATHPETRYKLYIQFKKVAYLVNKVGDREGAGVIADEMELSHPEHRLTREAKKLVGIIMGMEKEKSEVKSEQIKTYELGNNYPNPFNPNTTLSYQVPGKWKVVIKIFDILGKEIATLVDEEQEAGKYKVNFNGGKFASGVYVYRMTAGEFMMSKKMILVK